MDRVDLAILSALEKDGRQSFAELSDKVNLSKTPCWSRVQALEKSGAIRGYHADIAASALGFNVIAYVQVMIDPNRRSEFEAAVLAHTAVIECSTTAGEGDYLLKVVSSDVDGLDDLLRHSLSLLPGLQRSVTTICLKTIKRGVGLTNAILNPPKMRP